MSCLPSRFRVLGLGFRISMEMAVELSAFQVLSQSWMSGCLSSVWHVCVSFLTPLCQVSMFLVSKMASVAETAA